LLAAFLLLQSTGSTAGEAIDRFDRGILDETLWRTCQADPGLIGFGREVESGRAYLALRIDGERENVDTCASVAERGLNGEGENLSPSFFAERAAMRGALFEICPAAERRNGEPIIQRNELRFAPAALHPAVEDDNWYSMTFRLQGYGGDGIPECGSARWVVGQWKYERMPPGRGGSPFLAQRFDNGVLHLTMEDDGCRCMIAKVGGDPDLAPQAPKEPLEAALPLKCRYSEGVAIGERCTPAHLKLEAVDLVALSTLPDPRKGWVRMTYRIRAGGPEGARIDVYADGRFIVRARGDIAPYWPGNRVKFKFGHYRDKIPVHAELQVDEVCVSKDWKTCDSSITPRP
jgi:hypothetical protein